MSGQDSSFVRTLIMVIAGIVVFMVISLIVANTISSMSKAGDASQDPRVQAKIEENIKPVGMVNVGAAPAPVAAAAADPKETYQSACFACHGTGAAGAPKLGDKGAWKSRIAQGKDTLYEHALNGFKGMPPKGGRADLSDDAVKAVVDYLVAQGK